MSLISCSKVLEEKAYIDSKTGIEVTPAKPKRLMKHIDVNRIVCLGGYQAYEFAGNYGFDYAWVPNPRNSSMRVKCDLNTLEDGGRNNG